MNKVTAANSIVSQTSSCGWTPFLVQKGQDFVGRVELAKPDMQDWMRLCRVSLRSTRPTTQV